MTHPGKFVSSVPEYRRTSRGNFKHKLEDILMLVILGRLSKCITRAEILQFGKRHLKRLQAKGIFLHGLASEATLCRVFQSIDDPAYTLPVVYRAFQMPARVPGLSPGYSKF